MAILREGIGRRAERNRVDECRGIAGDLAAIEGRAKRQVAVEDIVSSGARQLLPGDEFQKGPEADARRFRSFAGLLRFESPMPCKARAFGRHEGIELRQAGDLAEGAFEQVPLGRPMGGIVDEWQFLELGEGGPSRICQPRRLRQRTIG